MVRLTFNQLFKVFADLDILPLWRIWINELTDITFRHGSLDLRLVVLYNTVFAHTKRDDNLVLQSVLRRLTW